jgi:hypothetical protein
MRGRALVRGKIASSSLLYLPREKAEVPSFLHGLEKKMFTYFFMLGGPNYFRACSQGFTLIDYANLISFTIYSSLPKLWDCK